MTAEPTLAEDEARLAGIAGELDAALARCVPAWLGRVSLSLAPTLDPDDLEVAIAATMAELGPALTLVLTSDVDAGAGSPLAEVRARTGRITALLADAGVAAVPRDEFDARAFPDDRYALGPAAFADIDESLQEPGLMWGAARAHVHLRRRRELEP